MRWPDVEDMVAHVLDPLIEAEVVSTLHGVTTDGKEPSAANQFVAALPLIRVTRIGGVDDGVSDVARVRVVSYSTTRSEAVDLAEQARVLLCRGRHRTPAGVIDTVTTEVGPHENSTADPSLVRRWTSTYRVSARRR